MPQMKLYEEVGESTEELILKHLGLVKRVALHLKVRVPAFMELNELIQAGMIGLLEAAKSYDSNRGVEFENYAHTRVKGAMIDEVRRMSALPRSAVAIIKTHNEAAKQLEGKLGRSPSQAELAEHLGKEVDSLQKERGVARQFETVSMEVLEEEVLSIPSGKDSQPQEVVEQAEFMEVLVEAIDRLPERDKLVMSLYYVEELNLKEIGEVVGVSESRISQILSSNVKNLRKSLKIETILR
ncbi:MAG: FliA/WhiG family RNA polymerase sigma factor [Proteobacteria bacterium]|nr:FliA/WhiG family RNA polymerase sigma factor [Pseudomonadota bacterium]